MRRVLVGMMIRGCGTLRAHEMIVESTGSALDTHISECDLLRRVCQCCCCLGVTHTRANTKESDLYGCVYEGHRLLVS